MPVLRQLWTRPSERERFYLFPDLIPLPQFTTETFAGGATVELQAYLNHLAHLSDDPVDIVPCFEQADQMQCWQAKTQVPMTAMAHDAWVLSGSLCGWGDGAIPLFELVVFLWISRDIRVARLRQREHKRFGERILPGGDMYESSQAFLARAASYDAGGLDMRSRRRHDQWLGTLPCPIICFEGEYTLEEHLADGRDAAIIGWCLVSHVYGISLDVHLRD